MICPRCGGAGRIRRSFLGLFGWYSPCPSCRRVATFSSFERDEVTYRDPGPSGAGGTTPSTPTPQEWRPGGGAGGGGGASGSWKEAAADTAAGHSGTDELPLIVDPFGSGGAGGGDAAGDGTSAGRASGFAEATDGAGGGGDAERAVDADGDSAQDGGTSY